MRRLPRPVLTAALAGVGLALIPTGAGASGVRSDLTADLASEATWSQSAVVQWDGTRQRMLLSLGVAPDSEDLAIIIPTPRPASVRLGDPAVLDQLAELSAPRVEIAEQWWPSDPSPPAGATALAAAATGSTPAAAAATSSTGPIQATTLAPGGFDALADWLAENGYTLTPALQDAVEPYVDERWSFVAVEVDAGATGSQASGALEITFATDTLVVPVRLAAASTEPLLVRTYVIDGGRMDRTDAMAAGADVVFAGAVTSEQAPALATWLTALDGEGYVTASEQLFANPASAITTDLTFLRSEGPDVERVVVQTVDRKILGMFAGPVLTALGLLGAGVAVLGALRWREARRRPATEPAVGAEEGSAPTEPERSAISL